jgi:hypothetical protein
MSNPIALKDKNTGLSSANNIGTADMLFNPGAMECIERAANLMASGKSTVPQHLQGNPADCMAIIMQSAQWGMNPFAVAQKTHLVSGNLGYEAQLINAVITANAPVTTRLQYEWFGNWNAIFGKFEGRKNDKNKVYHVPNWNPQDEEGLGVKVWATLSGEDEPRVLELLLKQAQVRNSTLWASDPKQQLAYLAIKRWSRLYTPDVIMGVYSPDELAEIPERDMGSAEVVTDVDDLLKGGDTGTTIEQEPGPQQEPTITKEQIAGTLEAFKAIGIIQAQIEARLGHQANYMAHQEYMDLRQVYGQITKEGRPLDEFFQMPQPQATDPGTSPEQIEELLNLADSNELADIEVLINTLDDAEAKDRLSGMLAVRRMELDSK